MGTIFKPPLAILQSGAETAKGTIVTTTSKVPFDEFRLKPIDLLYRPKMALGLYVANRGNELPVKRGIEWGISGELVHDQFQLWLEMAVKGGTSATGTTGAYVWTMTRAAAVAPALKSRSFEYRLTDGTTPSDWKFGYAMATALGISAAEKQPVKFSIDGFARRLQTATLTAGQALPTILMAPVALSNAYIDATWATLGTTPITGQILSWKWHLDTGEVPVDSCDARSDLDFTLDELDPDKVKVSLDIVMLAQAGGQWSTERTAAEAGTLRAVQIQADAQASPARQIMIKGLYKYTAGSLFPTEEKDGLQAVTLKLEGSTDLTNFLELILKNGVNTLT